MKTILFVFLFVFFIGNISNAQFGEAQSKRDIARFKAWHWYELSDAQSSKLVTLAKVVKESERRPLNVICADSDCRALAEDVVDAFVEAGWKVKFVSTLFSPPEVGLYCSGHVACQTLTIATGIKTHEYDGPKDVFTLVFGPKK